jgi:hypothetical protein
MLRAWEVVLPEVTRLRISIDGSGVPISTRISKDAPAAVRIARPGEDGVGSPLKQEVNFVGQIQHEPSRSR